MSQPPHSQGVNAQEIEQLLGALGEQLQADGVSGELVSRLRQLVGRLRKYERQLRIAMEQIPIAVVIYDSERRFQFVSAELIRMSGRREQEWLGRRDEEILPSEVTEAYLPALRRVFEQRMPQKVEWTMQVSSGSRMLAATFVPLLHDDRNLDQVLGVIEDVTGRKLLEQRMATEHEVIRILDEAPTLAYAVPRILEAVSRTADWDIGAFWMVDQQQKVLRCVEMWHRSSFHAPEFEKETRCLTFAPNIGLPGRVWASGSPLALPTVTKDSNFPRRWAALPAGLHGALGFPVMLGAEVLGVIELFSREVRAPDERLLAMMSVIGGQIGQRIHRKQAEEALQQSEAHNAAVLAAALDAIVSMDHNGRVTEWNPSAERIFGYARGEAVGQLLAELIIPPALRERHQNGLARYLATGYGPLLGRRLEITAIRRGGGEFPVELAITATTSGATVSFTGHLRDITDRKRIEAQMQAKERAEAASRAKDQFLAVLSHELRTPLTPVLTTIQMMERDATLSPQQRESIRLIHRNVELETKLIDDLLDLTRISRGKIQLHLGPVDLHSVLGHVVAICDSDIREKQLHLTMRLNASHHHVAADAARLQQVFWNLLKNAIKFTRPGGYIHLSSYQASMDRIAVSIQDNGEGIEPELLPQIFNAFEQGGAEKTRKFGGLGLGLAISKALVDQHGGRLMAFSEGKGKGARFIVELCVSLEAEKASFLARAVRTGESVPSSGKSGRILLVEDNPDTARVMESLLRSEGYEVRVATSVSAALEAARTEDFDLLLCDIGLPDGSGLDVMRQLSRERRVTGIALSGYGMDEDIHKSKEAGFAEHLTKPLDLGLLERTLERVMGERGAGKG